MPDTDLLGDDYNVTDVDYTDPHICQSACTSDDQCKAFVYVTRPPKVGSCCLKSSVPNPSSSTTCTAGIKNPKPPQGTQITVPLIKGIDAAIDVRVFVDNTFVEIYIMEGRLAFTLLFNGGETNVAGTAGMDIFARGASDIEANNVNVWHMNSIWTDSPSVLLQNA